MRKEGVRIVGKADGLAAGKGVVIAMTEAEALAAVDMMFGGTFGASGAEVVIEEFMQGEEASFLALCDGEHALPLATAQDHKRAYDGDTGPNTGGMGSYSPAPALTVIMATKGYPGDYGKGSVIGGLDEAAKVEGVEIFHAGTASKDGRIVANGGRVLNICALGKTVTEAQNRAYQAVDRINWPEGFCRRDIGWQAVAREKAS